MNFKIIIPLQPGEGLISHGSIQFSSSNVVVFAVGLETMNNNNNYNNNKIGSANPKIDFNEIFLRLLQGVGGV